MNGVQTLPTVLLTADQIVTMDPDRPHAQAVLVRDGRIVEIGDREDAERWRGSVDEVYDFGAATVTPGLVDNHSHPLMGLRACRGIDLGCVGSLDELAEALRRGASAAPAGVAPGGWVRGWNLSPRAYAGTAPDAEFLEAVLPGRPVLVKTFDFHTAFASRSVLQAAGVTGPVQFPSRARVVCDEAGRPTGVLEEMEAVAHVEDRGPQVDLAQEADDLLTLLQDMARSGLTLVHSLLMQHDELHVLRRLEERVDLPLRYRVAPVCAPDSGPEELLELVHLQAEHGRRWAVEGVKFFLDGTIDNGTAWLAEPDTHGQSVHSSWRSLDAFEQAATTLAGLGIPLYVHAIGDAAVTCAIDVLGQVGPPTRGTHRIEHLEVLSPQDAGRLATSGVAASIQPAHCCSSVTEQGADNWSRRLGEQRRRRGFVQLEVLRAGGLVTLSSDWPIGPFDPREILAIAELRRLPGNVDQEPVRPAQAISRLEALSGMTVAPARAAGRDDGVVRPGSPATFTVFDGDVLTVPADDLPSIAVVATFMDGELLKLTAAEDSEPQVARSS
ncbi:amidohydrolase [Kineococcus sp. NPDC059986]|uniref:amidohydrolase n=1 Tax=Kineococcus sp. NPDC059986 TaxID=3155538 RepID=UPI00344C53C3